MKVVYQKKNVYFNVINTYYFNCYRQIKWISKMLAKFHLYLGDRFDSSDGRTLNNTI